MQHVNVVPNLNIYIEFLIKKLTLQPQNLI